MSQGEQYRGPIIGTGDSWFSYSSGDNGTGIRAGFDIIYFLKDYFKYEIDGHFKAGDKLALMTNGSQFQSVLKMVERKKPRVFLFSGGGNDVAGEGFELFLSPIPNYINHSVLNANMIIFENCYKRMIRKIQTVSPDTQIIAHGYGYPPVTGKGVGQILGFLTGGPWLLPALNNEEIPADHHNDIVIALIDRYYDLLFYLESKFDNFHVLDFRSLLKASDWDNELHVKDDAYQDIASRFHDKIQRLVGGNPYKV